MRYTAPETDARPQGPPCCEAGRAHSRGASELLYTRARNEKKNGLLKVLKQIGPPQVIKHRNGGTFPIIARIILGIWQARCFIFRS